MVSVKVESIMKNAQSSRASDLSESLMKWDTNSDVVSNLNNLGTYNNGNLQSFEASFTHRSPKPTWDLFTSRGNHVAFAGC